MKVKGSPNKAANAKKAGLVIGRQRFTRISAVEGIGMTGSMKARTVDFDRTGISAEERRQAIIRAHRKD